jgi:DNA-binding protein YbaB
MPSPFAQNLVERIAAIQEQIDGAAIDGARRPADEVVVGTTKNDSVRVSFREDGMATNVEIDPDVVDPIRVRELERLVAAAVQDATERWRKLRTERLTEAIRAMVEELIAPALGEEL